MRKIILNALSLFLILSLPACQREESKTQTAPPAAPAATEFQLIALDLGNAIGADKRVVAPVAAFAPTDTIYASVIAKGSPGTAVTARWLYQNTQLVSESTQALDMAAPITLEFHIAKPTGWPKGSYRLELLANGAAVGARDFEVR